MKIYVSKDTVKLLRENTKGTKEVGIIYFAIEHNIYNNFEVTITDIKEVNKTPLSVRVRILISKIELAIIDFIKNK